MTHPQYPGYVNLETISYSIQFINYSANPIYISDGSRTKPRILPPLLAVNGSRSPEMPQGAEGKIIAVRSSTREAPVEGNKLVAHEQAFWDTVAIPPYKKEELMTWSCISKEYNIAMAGSPQALEDFVKEYGSAYDYIKTTDFATRFHNTINYGIMNVTGKPLYQVDDTGSDDAGYADIITIPAGNTTPFPLWDQQYANNKFNIDNNKPYVRTYRYELMNVNETSFVGHMRERIYYWDNQHLYEDGFLFIPQFHICIFDSFEMAEAFILKYKTIEAWEAAHIKTTVYDDVKQYTKEFEDKMNARNKLIIKGCAIFVSLQLAWKLGELISWYVKEKKSKENNDKKGFLSISFTGVGPLSDALGSTLL